MSKYEQLKKELDVLHRNREGTSSLIRRMSIIDSQETLKSFEVVMSHRHSTHNALKETFSVNPKKEGTFTPETLEAFNTFLDAYYNQLTDRQRFISEKLRASETLLNEEEEL